LADLAAPRRFFHAIVIARALARRTIHHKEHEGHEEAPARRAIAFVTFVFFGFFVVPCSLPVAPRDNLLRKSG
jgi:hypothetical protein